MLFERLGCLDYFIYLLGGERAKLLDTTNPDWAPTVKLGHDKIKQNVSQLAVSEMLVPKRGMKTNRTTMRWLLPLRLEKVVRWRLFKKKNMLKLKYLVSVRYQCQVNV